MLHLTMKAHVRRSGKPVLILGCDSRRALTIDHDGNLRGYWLTALKATALEAQLRMEIDTRGVEGMLEAISAGEEGGFDFEVSK
jgi:hypothetical protein